MSKRFFLRCSRPPYLRFALQKPCSVLGRSSACDFVVDAVSVSRKHAEIRLDETGILVADLGSRNGTFIGNLRVDEVRPLFHDQVVRFGDVTFVVEVETEPGEEVTDDPQPEGEALATVETLSKAQRRVFDLLITGMPEKQISGRLNLSPHTVHNHVRNILRIFDVHSRTELLAALLPKH